MFRMPFRNERSTCIFSKCFYNFKSDVVTGICVLFTDIAQPCD